MTKGEAFYQAKLIIDQLSDEEYNLISEKDIKYINDNCEINENIKIDPNIPLSEQDINPQTWEILNNVIENVDYLELNKYDEDIVSIKLEKLDLEDKIFELKNDNNTNMAKAKELVLSYKDELKECNSKIENLKKTNEDLYGIIKKVPKFIRKIFIKKEAEQLYIGK